MSRGVIYIATGESYVEEAKVSAKSLKSHMPNINITLYTDKKQYDSKVFDRVKILENPSYDFGDSVLKPEMVEYDKNLLLDTDTYVTDDISELFELLDKYSLIARLNPRRTGSVNHKYDEEPPQSFPQYNTGVIGFRDNSDVRDFFDKWSDKYNTKIDNYSNNFNQPSFREVAYNHDIKIGAFSSEYNFRINEPGFADGKVKIVHGSKANYALEDIAKILNESSDPRSISLDRYPLKVHVRTSKIYELQYKLNAFIELMKTEGLSKAVKSALKFLSK